MAKLVFSPRSQTDLDDAADYISNILQNPAAAQRFVRNMKRQMSVLHEFPKMGTPLQENEGGTIYRRLVYGNYVTIYHIEGDTVYVDRILYGRRDYLSLLFGEEAEGSEPEDEGENE